MHPQTKTQKPNHASEKLTRNKFQRNYNNKLRFITILINKLLNV